MRFWFLDMFHAKVCCREIANKPEGLLLSYSVSGCLVVHYARLPILFILANVFVVEGCSPLPAPIKLSS